MKHTPWLMLTVLVVVRTALGVQFQSIGSLGPSLVEHLAIDYAALGMLIGAYHFPGVFVALPIGWLNARFGDRRLALTALALMTLGAAGLAVAPRFGIAMVARIVGGIGASGLNTVLTKMAMDRFTGSALTLAIGFLMGAWPLGQGLALMTLPAIAAATNWRVALGATALLCGIGFIALAILLPRDETVAAVPQRHRLNAGETAPLLAAAMTWAGFNAAMTIVLGFAPAYFVRQGMSSAAAGPLVSLMSLPLIPLIPLGGWLSRFTRWPLRTIAGFLVAILVTVVLLPHATAPGPVLLLLLGAMMGTPVALMMAMPAQVLAPESRAIGMGLFYLVFNANVAVLPTVAGWSRDMTGLPRAPFYVAAACLLSALLALAFYAAIRRPPAADG